VSTTDYPAPGLTGTRLPGLRMATWIRQIPAETWAIFAITVVAAAVRIITIDNQSLWMDEALTAYEAHLPFGAMLGTVAHVETTPPLYFVLTWCWTHVFGTGEIALRSISTIAGIALVPITYIAARELVSRWTGLLAAAFVAVNPFLIWYSQEARSYMLLAALTAASFMWFVRALADRSRRSLAWWTGCSALAVMTHFFAGFLVAPEALWLLWRSRGRQVWFAVVAVAAVQALMLPLAISDTSHDTSWIVGVPRTHRVATMVFEWGVSLLSRRGHYLEAFTAGAGLLLVVVALLFFGGDRRHRWGAIVAGSIAAFIFVAPLALAFVGQDYFLSRNEMPAFVPLAIVVAAACAAPRARLIGAILAGGLLALFGFAAIYVQTHPFLERPDWRVVAHSLGPALVPRAILAANGTTADPLKIYLPHVNWVQPRNRRELVGEIDVVGALKRVPLAQQAGPAALDTDATAPAGRPIPRGIAPRGTRLLARFRLRNWVIARFALAKPRALTIKQLNWLAPRLFLHAPAALLIFIQPRAKT
jgi:mannosyltransferase